ncbi:MAG: decaprenyl-phosphate phosphoribosyltransferase [bacterium]|nr:decaprenyl-phosphate phosphoribosyltransferase [bacterium]
MPYIRLLRLHQWIKNGFVLAPLVFAGRLLEMDSVVLALSGFTAYCFASSATYVFNDIFDRDQDRHHPFKCRRPVASGEVSVPAANVLGAGLLLTSILIAAGVGIPFLWTLLAYLALQVGYNVLFRNMVILDILVIALGFVLRAVAGTYAIDVVISPWLILCTLLIALFLGFAKRRQEIILLGKDAVQHRRILQNYSVPLLDQLIGIVTAATIVSYAIYTLSPDVTDRVGSPYMILTLPFVIYGIFRYLYLVHVMEKGGSPTRDFLTDGPLLVSTFLWGVVSAVLIYL